LNSHLGECFLPADRNDMLVSHDPGSAHAFLASSSTSFPPIIFQP
jgi:hypothetical protein